MAGVGIVWPKGPRDSVVQHTFVEADVHVIHIFPWLAGVLTSGVCAGDT